MGVRFLLEEHPLFSPSQVGRAFFALARSLGADASIVVAAGEGPSEWRGVRFEYADPRGRGAAASFGPDDTLVVVADHPARRWARLLARRRTRARLVVLPLGFPPWRYRSRGGGRWARAFYGVMVRRLLRRADHVVVASAWEEAEARRAHAASVARLPFGLDVERARRLARAGRDSADALNLPGQYAVALGPSVPNRRTSLVEVACQALGLPLVLLGGRKATVAERVLEVRAVSNAHRFAVLSGASCLLHVPMFEAQSLHIVEALAVGVRFVASDTGTARELSALSGCPIVHASAPHDAPSTIQGLFGAFDRLCVEPPMPGSIRSAGEAYDWRALLPDWQRLLLDGVTPRRIPQTGAAAPGVVAADAEEADGGVVLGQAGTGAGGGESS